MKELEISEQTLFTDWKNIDASSSYASSKFGNFTENWNLVIKDIPIEWGKIEIFLEQN